MSFMPTPRARLVPGFGKKTAKIAIVGDFTTGFDDKALRAFAGPPGTVLEQCLQVAQILTSDVYFTNCIKTKTTRTYKQSNTEYWDDGKHRFTELGLEHARTLRAELNGHSANVIVCCGNAALRALTDHASVAKYRGYVCASSELEQTRKIIPTYSPASTLRGTYINRHCIVADLRKAKVESAFPEIIRPERTLIYEYSGVEEALQWIEFLEKQPVICFDIEVINYCVSCISFSHKPDLGVVIPFGNSEFKPDGWTEEEEVLLWRGVQRILGNPNSTKVVQNGSFDIHFLLTECGIEVRGPIHDTMIGHSVMFPELPKGLDFLGSIYCGSQEYWKDSVKFNNVKGES